MNHKYTPHWTQPLIYLRSLLILPPLAELAHRGYPGPAVLILLCLCGIQYLPRLWIYRDRVQFRFLLRHDFHTRPAMVEVYRPLHLRLLGGVPYRLHFSMHALPLRQPISLSVRSACDLLRTICPGMSPLPHPSGIWMRILAAAFQPHLAAGWALAAPLLRRFDPVRLTALLQTLPPVVTEALSRLPAPWVLMTVTVGAGWCLAFLRRLEESAHPHLYGGMDVLAVQCGLLTQRGRVFFLRRCAGAELRQHFILALCGIGSVFLYTGQKSPVLLLPAAPEKAFFSLFCPQKDLVSETFAPPASARTRFGRVELFLLAAVLPVCCRAAVRQAFLLQYGCMVLGVFLCLRMWAQQCAFPRTMVRLDAEQLTVCRCKGLSVVTTIVPRSAAVAVSIRTHWFQRRAGLCTLRISVPGLPVLPVKHLRLRDGLRIRHELTGIK